MNNDAAAKAVIFAGGAFILFLFAKKMNVFKATTGTAGGGVNLGSGSTPTTGGVYPQPNTEPQTGGVYPRPATSIGAEGGVTGGGGTMGATSGHVGVADPTAAVTLDAWRTPIRITNADGTITEAFAI